MTTVTMKGDDQLRKALANVTDNIPKHLAVITNKTSSRSKSIMAKEVVKTIRIKQKEVKRKVRIRRKSKWEHHVKMDDASRINLRHFIIGKQTQNGIRYQIWQNASPGRADHAFQGPVPGRMNIKWKGMPFIRRSIADPKSKIRPLGWGPSPVGVIIKNKKLPHINKLTAFELRKQTLKRIKWLELKK